MTLEKSERQKAKRLAGRRRPEHWSGMQHKLVGGHVDRPSDEFDRMLGLSASQRKRLRREWRGLCICCNEAPVAGKRKCQRHLDAGNEANRRRYAAAKAEHLRVYGMTRAALAKLERLSPAWQAERLIGLGPAPSLTQKPVGGEKSPHYVKRCVDEWLQKYSSNRQEGP